MTREVPGREDIALPARGGIAFTCNAMDEASGQFEKSRAKGFAHICQGFRYSLDGFRSAFWGEEAFRLELLLVAILLPLAFAMPVSWAFRALLLASTLLILLVELFNSALETVVDYISLDLHPMAKRAKDLASAAVFMSFCVSGVCWFCAVMECIPKLREKFGL
jgi:diacylglycerol kinase (ATP)